MTEGCTRKLLWLSLGRLAYLDVPHWVEESLKTEFPQFQTMIARDEETVYREIADAEILVTWKLHAEQFAQCKKLKWIHSPAAGVGQLLVPALIQSAVVVTNGRTVHAIPVAEHAMALVLALARSLGECFRYQAQGAWGHTPIWQGRHMPTEINGKILGLVGLGSIGGEIAVRAAALGMRVVAVKRNPSEGGRHVERIYSSEQLPAMLEQVDYLVLAAPATSETHHLIGEAEMRRMKPSAYLINIARGSLVDTDALVHALNAGDIAGAALDVTDPEPLPPGHPLWSTPNVLITHHVGGATERFWQRQLNLLQENLRRYRDQQPLLNLVDKAKGY